MDITTQKPCSSQTHVITITSQLLATIFPTTGSLKLFFDAFKELFVFGDISKVTSVPTIQSRKLKVALGFVLELELGLGLELGFEFDVKLPKFPTLNSDFKLSQN